MKRKNARLTLNRQTVRMLDTSEIRAVKGAGSGIDTWPKYQCTASKSIVVSCNPYPSQCVAC